MRAKKESASRVKEKLVKGLLQRMDAPDPVEEFQALQDDPLASWSFLSDQEFLQRILTVLFVAFLPCFYLALKVYPMYNDLGDLLPQNLLAAVSFGFSSAAFCLMVVLLRMGYRQVEVNKLLRQGSVFWEIGGGGYFVKKKSDMKKRKVAMMRMAAIVS